MSLSMNDAQIERPSRVSVVVPVFNEEMTVRPIIDRVLAVPGILEVIVVNDGSTDGTSAVLEKLARDESRVKVIEISKNSGKTAALKAGFAATAGDIVIIQDADLEYDPNEIPDVVAPIEQGFADVVYGSRFMVKRAARVIYFYHYVANKFLTMLSNSLTNLNMTDIETCYKAFRGDIIRNMKITSSGFGFEVEVTAKVAKLKCALYEVPISYYGRTYEEGKKITYLDGVAALYYVIRFNLFCSLRRSYVKVPQLERREPQLLEAPR